MPLVQLSWPQRGINKTAAMDPPVKMAVEGEWLRKARKVLPQIPDVGKSGRWTVREVIATTCTIIFHLIDQQTHERCSVVIDRRHDRVSGRTPR